MLSNFLIEERDKILAICAEKLMRLRADKRSSEEMELGLPVFYDELIEVLRADEVEERGTDDISFIHKESAVRRGIESSRLGYTISQVVQGYGALCQAITQYLEDHNQPISNREFNRLNLCLDTAIAQAVSSFDVAEKETLEQGEVQRLGFLAHELRNALSNAVMAYRMIKSGRIGIGGNTGQILEDSHACMTEIIDRSLAEVRLRNEPIVSLQSCRVIHLLSEIEITASSEANDKSINIHVEGDPDLVVYVDRHLILSAISNLVQNAIKFTKQRGIVWIRCRTQENRAIIEVEDQCGGLPEGKAEELFQPFSQKDENRSGLGLGLTIARRSVALNGGMLTVRNIAQQGCVFTIDLPCAPALFKATSDVAPIH